ncbi:MAG: glycosyltransferase family 2 protein, partial [Pseudomonadota bacterium]
RHFQVLIYDNASTDRTGEICQAVADRDPRFIYHRNPENIGSAQNFLDVLAAADTEYFLWRADDDLTSPDFFEHLVARLDEAPGAALAACRVESRRPAKNRIRRFGFVEAWRAPRIVNIVRRMFWSQPSWIYGLWRTEALRRYYIETWEKYPKGWANDHLVLLQVILDDALTGDSRPLFVQQIGVRPGSTRQKPTLDQKIGEKTSYLSEYRRLCRQSVAERDWSSRERWILDRLIGFYAAKRVNASDFSIWKLKVRRAILGGNAT